MIISDNRSKKIVFMSHCLLNQNARGGAFAVKQGAIKELVQVFIDKGIGIAQLPCPELYVWGGVHRKALYDKQPFVFHAVGKAWFPVLEFLLKFWLLRHKRYCRRIALREVGRMQDYIREGYEIVGVIGVDDSPTCGVDKQLELLDAFKKKDELGIKLQDLENQKLEKLREIILATRKDGPGALYQPMKSAIRKRKLDIKVIGFDPWADARGEAERILSILEIESV